jgi:hypothetical protein
MGDVLLSAADYLEEHGWCQGVNQKPGGAVCPEQAILVAAGGDLAIWGAAINDLAAHLKEYSVTKWNDTRGRTKAEVIEAMRGAALARARAVGAT